MSVIENLKTEWMVMRRNKHWLASTLGFVLSEVNKIGKNDGNRQTTDDEAIKVIQKIVSNLNKTMEAISDEKELSTLKVEKELLEGFLPQMASDQDIVEFLKDHFSEKNPKKGEIMKALRDHFGAQIDMKNANKLITDLYGV